MVSFRTGPSLFEAIRAVQEQSAPVELQLVDNGNPPDVVAQLQQISATDSRIKLITGQGNVGFGAGCNIGARAAKGDFIMMVNPDCVLAPGLVGELVKRSAQLPRPHILSVRVLDERGVDQRGSRRAFLTPASAFNEVFKIGSQRLNYHDAELPTSTIPVEAVSGAFMFMPRDDFWSIGGYDEGYFLHVEDLDLCLRFNRAGGKIFFIPDLSVKHYGATSHVTKPFIERHKAKSFSRYFHKNFGNQYPRPFLWLLDAAIYARFLIVVAKGFATKMASR
jgi:GT2 family glycosyltransferase